MSRSGAQNQNLQSSTPHTWLLSSKQDVGMRVLLTCFHFQNYLRSYTTYFRCSETLKLLLANSKCTEICMLSLEVERKCSFLDIMFYDKIICMQKAFSKIINLWSYINPLVFSVRYQVVMHTRFKVTISIGKVWLIRFLLIMHVLHRIYS